MPRQLPGSRRPTHPNRWAPMTPQRGGGSDGNDWEGYITADQPKVIVITISYADSGRPWEAMTTCVVIASWAVCVSTL